MSEQLTMDLNAFERGFDASKSHKERYDWTDEKIAELRTHADNGLSSSQIAKAMGGGLTRNAVIGKRARLRVHTKNPSAQSVSKAKARTSKLYPDRIFKPYTKTRKPPMDFDNYQSPTMEVVPLNLTFAQLQPGQCKYPYGDRDFLFCGLPVVGEKSYCWPHYCLTHTTSSGQRPNFKYHLRKVCGVPARQLVQKLEYDDPNEIGTAA